MNVTEKTKLSVIAIRIVAAGDTTFAASSRKSVLRLMMELETRLANEDNRIPVLQALTGIPITSQTQLTQQYTSAIIDEVIHGDRNIISETERLIEEHPDIRPFRIFPWNAPDIDMPTLPEANTQSGTGDARSIDNQGNDERVAQPGQDQLAL